MSNNCRRLVDISGLTDEANIERLNELQKLFDEKGKNAAQYQLKKKKPREQTVFVRDLAKELCYLYPDIPLKMMYPMLKDLFELITEHLIQEKDVHINRFGILRLVFTKDWEGNAYGKKGEEKRVGRHFIPSFKAFKELKDRTCWGYDKKAHNDTHLLKQIKKQLQNTTLEDIDYENSDVERMKRDFMAALNHARVLKDRWDNALEALAEDNEDAEMDDEL